MEARIYLDISRLLSAGIRATPTGIERVELAYVKRFGRSGQARFVAYYLGRMHFIPNRFALAYTESLEHSWNFPGRAGRFESFKNLVLVFVVLTLLLPRAYAGRPERKPGNPVYLNLSHHNLDAKEAIANFKRRTGAKMLFFVHDLIPITYPEYARPGQAEVHRRRMDTVAAMADAVVVNSAATREDFLHYLRDRPARPAVHVAHLGVVPHARAAVADANAVTPYFLMLATIEPRKNHLLLLNLWRKLATESQNPPRLIVVGRRGWENEMVLDMLERCEAIAGVVEERRDVRDEELAGLMRHARALLLPSFAEGYGLPVAEALDAGTPVICSDLPALREIGGAVPEYIDPLDGLAWQRAILEYAQDGSLRRAAQCDRLQGWSAPRWDSHLDQVAEIIEALGRA